MAKPHPDRIRNNADICDLSSSPLLDELTGSQLVVYIRLLGKSVRTVESRMIVHNRDLHLDASMASRALARLEAIGLIRIHATKQGRKIEVL